jgi:hypothetical protein
MFTPWAEFDIVVYGPFFEVFVIFIGAFLFVVPVIAAEITENRLAFVACELAVTQTSY